jgi:hypothetical protein
MIISRQIHLKVRNVSDKSFTTSQNTHFMFSNIPPPPPSENRAVCEVICDTEFEITVRSRFFFKATFYLTFRTYCISFSLPVVVDGKHVSSLLFSHDKPLDKEYSFSALRWNVRRLPIAAVRFLAMHYIVSEFLKFYCSINQG